MPLRRLPAPESIQLDQLQTIFIDRGRATRPTGNQGERTEMNVRGFWCLLRRSASQRAPVRSRWRNHDGARLRRQRVAAQAPETPLPEQPGQGPERSSTTPWGRPRPGGFAGQPVNIKVEVTITDERGAGASPQETVTVVTGDQLSGFIRTQTLFPASATCR